MTKPFIVFKVSWNTQRKGNEGLRDVFVNTDYQTLKFLQDNDLVKRRLIETIDDVVDDLALSSDDLTDEGMALMRGGYQTWLKKVDNGMPPEDWSILEKSLKKIRESRNEDMA